MKSTSTSVVSVKFSLTVRVNRGVRVLLAREGVPRWGCMIPPNN